jgi:cyclase
VKTWLSIVAVAGALAGPIASAQLGQPAKLDLVKVNDDIYVIHNDYVPGNITALVTDDGVLLVDTKYAVDYENVEAMLRTVTDKPIVYVINTHFHDDHSGANQMFQAEGARVVASENARKQMVKARRSEGLPDVTIGDGGTVYIGGKRVELYYFGRAHTDGDIVALFPDYGVMASGDIYANDPGTPEYVDYGGGGSARDWPATLTGALTLDFDTVVPGHGTVATHADMAGFRDDTKRLADMVHSMLQQGKSRADVEAMLRNEFHFADFQINGSLDGIMNELR